MKPRLPPFKAFPHEEFVILPTCSKSSLCLQPLWFCFTCFINNTNTKESLVDRRLTSSEQNRTCGEGVEGRTEDETLQWSADDGQQGEKEEEGSVMSKILAARV